MSSWPLDLNMRITLSPWTLHCSANIKQNHVRTSDVILNILAIESRGTELTKSIQLLNGIQNITQIHFDFEMILIYCWSCHNCCKCDIQTCFLWGREGAGGDVWFQGLFVLFWYTSMSFVLTALLSLGWQSSIFQTSCLCCSAKMCHHHT